MRMLARLLGFFGAVLGSSAVSAAPQMLGLLATGAAVPLVCDAQRCTAELSVFCLQKERAAPATGTAYRLMEGGALALVVTDPRGAARTIEVRDARFESLRGMNAVRVTIDRRSLAGATGAALQVAANASLIPVPDARQARPLTAAEIGEATGVLRALGTHIVDQSPEALVLRGLNRALNRPHNSIERRSNNESAAVAARIRQCAREVAHTKAMRSGTIGIYGYWTGRGIGHEPSLRACIEAAHDEILGRLNERYWNAKDSLM